MVPVAPRPDGYNPLGVKNLDPEWIRRLGQTGKDCYDAILAKDAEALGASMNECMECWEAILPDTVRHETVTVDLVGILSTTSHSIPGRCIPAAAAGTCTSSPRKTRAGRLSSHRSLWAGEAD